MNFWVIPAPGLEKEIVVPIPTPAVVPSPTVSTGLKYTCSVIVIGLISYFNS